MQLQIDIAIPCKRSGLASVRARIITLTLTRTYTMAELSNLVQGLYGNRTVIKSVRQTDVPDPFVLPAGAHRDSQKK